MFDLPDERPSGYLAGADLACTFGDLIPLRHARHDACRLDLATAHGSQSERVCVVGEVEIVTTSRLLDNHDSDGSGRGTMLDTGMAHEVVDHK